VRKGKVVEEGAERRLSTVEWMTALSLGAAGVPVDTALWWAGVIRHEYGSLIPTEANLRLLITQVQEYKGRP